MHWLIEAGLVNALVACGLAVVAYAAGRLAKRPAVTHTLWVLVLLKLLSPPLVDITQPPRRIASPERATALRLIPARAENATPAPDHVAQSGPTPATQDASVPASAPGATRWPISEALATVWLAGAAYVVVLGGVRIVRFHRLVSRAGPADGALRDLTGSVAQEMGVRRIPRVRVVEGTLSPLLWPGVAAATIVLPRGLLERLSREELRLTLAHELAHLVRHDHWVRWIELAATALYWWHPLVWFARRQLRAAEEECCDCLVLHHYPNRPRPYGEALLKIADWVSGAAPSTGLATGIGGASSLHRRIRMIVDYRPTSGRLGRGMKIAAVVAAVVLLPVSSRGLPFQDAGGEPAEATKSVSEDSTPADHASGLASIEERYRKVAEAFAGDELQALRQYLEQVEEHYRRAEALSRVGAVGGEPVKVAQLSYEVEMARAEWALRTGKPLDVVRTHYEHAQQHAEREVEAATDAYQAGRVDLDRVLQAHKNLKRARELLADGGREADRSALEQHIEALQGIYDRARALYREGARGGSADRYATAGFELYNAKAELADARGEGRQAMEYRTEALAFAQHRSEAVQAAYAADRVDMDALIQAQKDLLAARREVNALKREE